MTDSATTDSFMQSVGAWLQSQPLTILSGGLLLLLVIIVLFLTALVIVLYRYVGARAKEDKQRLEVSQLSDAFDNATQQADELRQKINGLESRRESLQLECVGLAKSSELRELELLRVRDQFENATQQLSDTEKNYASLEAKSRAEQVAMDEKLALLQQGRQQLTHEFESLANKIFEEKNKQHSKTSQAQLDATLSPLKNQLESFRKRVDDVYSHESKERHVLQDEIKKLREDSLRISEDATNLTNALKFDNKTQGNWGELTLIRALEMCGLREPKEYETQVVFRSDANQDGEASAGRIQIPDVIVHLPGGKDIIIDSKVSLVAYSRFFESETQEEKDAAIKQHLQSIKTHIKQLSAKSYQHLQGVHTLDYVMLYIPIEGAAAMALQSHEGLWEEAYSKNIVLVSPTNLLAILRSVETIWRHEKQNKNAEEIARQAGNLHDKFLIMIDSLDAVGKGLDAARKSYDTVYGQLSSGRGNLVSRVQRLEVLGAKTKRSIPAHLQHAVENVDDQLENRNAEPLEKSALAESKSAEVDREAVDDFETQLDD